MKIFQLNPETWGYKINFVDDNNVLVGFDFSSNCCERFGYLFTKNIPKVTKIDKSYTYLDRSSGENITRSYQESINETGIEILEEELKDYNFDKTFVQDLTPDEFYTEDGGAISFKLTNSQNQELYLTLYNIQNGYYSHGFNFSVDGEIIKTGRI